jgi:hypothetical protein
MRFLKDKYKNSLFLIINKIKGTRRSNSEPHGKNSTLFVNAHYFESANHL